MFTDDAPSILQYPRYVKNGDDEWSFEGYDTVEFQGKKKSVSEYKVTDTRKLDQIIRRIEESVENGTGLNKPVPDNPTEDDCGRGQQLKTVKERLDAVFNADFIQQLGEALKRGMTVKDVFPNMFYVLNPGSRESQGANFLSTALAMSFVCLTIEIVNDVQTEWNFSQVINLTCRENITEWITQVCTRPDNAVNCQTVGETLTKLCTVSNITQEMFIAIDFENINQNLVDNNIIEKLQQDLKNNVDITKDVIDGVLRAIENVGFYLTSSDRDDLTNFMADAVTAFNAQIDIDILNSVFSKFDASQLIEIEGVNAHLITQSMLLDVTISVVNENTVLNRIDRDFTQTLKNIWEEYVKSLDDYIRALMGNIVALIIVIAIIAGIVITFGIVAVIGARALKGQKGKPGSKPPGANASGTGTGAATGATSGAIVPAT